MSKHRERVQFRRKIHGRHADDAHDQLMAIYSRAAQGGVESSVQSEQSRVLKVQSEARERWDRRNAKRSQHPFVLHPERRVVRASAMSFTAPARHYSRLQSGQIVGHPRTMRQVKTAARQTRLARRDAFRNLRYDLL